MRLAGPSPNGGWRVVSVWESREQFDQFRRERLEPALKDAGLGVPQFQFWTPETVITPPR
jgi:heme-degrading monooxygenase HmoA